MANRQHRSPEIHLEYSFDRLLANKLEKIYEILVPAQVRQTGIAISGLKNGEPHENSSDIRTGIFGQATGGENHPQSNRDLVGICKKQRL